MTSRTYSALDRIAFQAAILSQRDRNERLRKALEDILREVGTSTLAYKIASEALKKDDDE